MNLSIPQASKEFGATRETIYRGLRGIGEDVEPRRAYTIRTIHRALCGDGKAERARLTRAQADREELEVAKIRGDVVAMSEASALLRRVLGPVRDGLVSMPNAWAARCNPGDPAMAAGALRECVDQLLRGLREDALPKALEELREAEVKPKRGRPRKERCEDES